MATLMVSQKSLTKYSTLYRWNGHFGHLSEAIKSINTGFGHFGHQQIHPLNNSRSMGLANNKKYLPGRPHY
jgi:hypothetical protein